MRTMAKLRPIQVLAIQPDNQYSTPAMPASRGCMQDTLGGYIQAIPTQHAILWVNEDGKLLGQPINMMATYLWWKLNPEAEGCDHIVGTCIVTGLADEHGEPQPVPQEIINLYTRMEAIRADEEDHDPNVGPDHAIPPLP